ncbi:alpha-ketoglutarate-dependent taurine dioxygenase [Mycena epipterygia]|nr:alpha-ketoglutarate-dependent taurine dioxygenase [Mycena epipterygia]
MIVTEEPVITYDINLPYHDASLEKATIKYPEYTPTWNEVWFDKLPPFEFVDPALRADKKKLNLLTPSVVIEDISPKMGTVLRNVQLTQLSDKGKDELSLLISERKIVAFPDQDFIDIGPGAQQKFMDYFGKRNYQPVSGSIPGYPGFHLIHRDGNKPELDAFFAQKTTSLMLGLLDGPKVGGDTVFAATDEAYRRLSPAMQKFLDGIKVKHSSANMINHTRLAGGLVRKDPITSIHSLVREIEWKTISDFLLQHLITSHDIQTRVHWSPSTIVMFDNCSTIHTAVVDYVDDENGAQPRHIFRLAAMAEKPIPVPDA